MGLSHSPKIVTNGLVLALDAANNKSYPGSGTSWNDLSGNSNTGTLTNGPTFSNANGGIIVLDGTNDYIIDSSTTNIPTGSSSRTIQMWIYPRTDTCPLVQLGMSGNQVYIMSFFNSAGTLYLFTDGVNVANNIIFSGSNLPTLNAWNHMTFGNSGQNWFYYLNGVPKLLGTWSVTLNTVGQKYVIGYRDDVFVGTTNGNISQTFVYNRALNENEILQNYNATAVRFGLPIKSLEGLYMVATGGDLITTSGSYKIHQFTTVGTSSFTVSSIGSTPTIEYLIVGGGGGGGGITNGGTGGGGGGQVVYNIGSIVSVGIYSIIVGDGGVGGPIDNYGGNGQPSHFSTYASAIGGGGGAPGNANGLAGAHGGGGGNGGSGGGSTVGGFSGASGGSIYNGGGGGGAGANGSGRNGGNGVVNSILGTPIYYGGGGAGGEYSGISSGGLGGGGNNSSTGSANTGGGGSGTQRGGSPLAGFKGGSGIVIIKYRYTN